MKKCKDCEYYVKLSKTSLRGQCHRFPPAVTDSTVDYNHWCGELKEKGAVDVSTTETD